MLNIGSCLNSMYKSLLKAIAPKRIRYRANASIYRDFGFTLLELLVVIAMVGILSAIAAPGWLSFANNQRLNSAQSQAFTTIRLAQSNAKRSQTNWQATFRNSPKISQYAVHPVLSDSATEAEWNALPWQNFDAGVTIVEDTESAPKTTFTKVSIVPEPDVYQIQFKANGSPNGSIGRITFKTNSGDRKKCVIVSTLLGSVRLAENSGCIP
jgi:prepilin-type N-terminal cleavage/methylation domain-containing protein